MACSNPLFNPFGGSFATWSTVAECKAWLKTRIRSHRSMATDPCRLRSFHETDVFKSENRAIRRRRKVVAESMWGEENRKDNGPPAKSGGDISDLVGVSLSGGGMRSASFSLGFLEELGTSGLLRYVDYLSTVSGGGYAGAVLSANAYAHGEDQKIRTREKIEPVPAPEPPANAGNLSTRRLMGKTGLLRRIWSTTGDRRASEWTDEDRDNAKNLKRIQQKLRTREELRKALCPFDPEPLSDDELKDMSEGQSPKLIQRLVYGGDYLFRDKFAFAARYCAGLVLNNAFMLSGVIVVAAVLAILWRGFDAPFSREALDRFDNFSINTSVSNESLGKQVQWYLSWLPKHAAAYFDFKWNDDSVRPFIPLVCFTVFWLFTVLVRVLWWSTDYVTWRPFDRWRFGQTAMRPLWTVLGLVVLATVLLISLEWDWLSTLGIVVAPAWSLLIRIVVTLVLYSLGSGPLRKWISFGIERFYQVVLALILMSFLVGLAVFLGNRDLANQNSPWNWQNSLIPWGTLATLLLPFLKPNLVVESATHPKNPAQRIVFLVASSALLIGGPLFCVFWIAREDFSSTAEARTAIGPYDFMELPDAAGGVNHLKQQVDADASARPTGASSGHSIASLPGI